MSRYQDNQQYHSVEVGFGNRIRKSNSRAHGFDSRIVTLGTLGTLLEEMKHYGKVTLPIQ
jgi:hypothetical protein